MVEFRTKHPCRRDINRAVSSHRDYKPDLKVDFNERCGYCNGWDRFKTTYYEVDHFIPVAILTIMTPKDYRNLVYSCRSCNRAKSKKWPTNDESIHNRNNEGFIDPCHEDYSKQFERTDKGEIKPVTELGKWMFFALNLHKPQHAIIWYLEQLHIAIEEIQKILNIEPESPLKEKLEKLFANYYNFDQQLRNL